jgi:hypothetical protein
MALHPGELPERLPGFVHFGFQLPDPDGWRVEVYWEPVQG